MAEGNYYHVRLRPYDTRKGCVRRVYSVYGIKFEAGKWLNVPEVAMYQDPGKPKSAPKRIELVEYLRGIRQIDDSEASPLAFEICTAEEAKGREAAEERRRKEEEAKASSPLEVDLTSGSLRAVSEETAPQPRKRGRPRKNDSATKVSDADRGLPSIGGESPEETDEESSDDSEQT